jgi:antitoxin FitA
MKMANLHVRNLDEELVRRLKRRAARHGRSAEAEHREILRQALSQETEMSWEERAARLRERLEGRVHTPSEILIREDRNSR